MDRRIANITYGGATVETVNLLWHQHWLFSLAGAAIAITARAVSHSRKARTS